MNGIHASSFCMHCVVARIAVGIDGIPVGISSDRWVVEASYHASTSAGICVRVIHVGMAAAASASWGKQRCSQRVSQCCFGRPSLETIGRRGCQWHLWTIGQGGLGSGTVHIGNPSSCSSCPSCHLLLWEHYHFADSISIYRWHGINVGTVIATKMELFLFLWISMASPQPSLLCCLVALGPTCVWSLAAGRSD